MKTSAQNRRVHQLLTALIEKKLNPRPDFQRRLVWTNDDKLAFIKTVLNDLPFPEIYICAGSLDPDTGAATEYLVDGQQRITTLHQYFSASPTLRLGKNVKPYASLTVEEKENFLEYEVVVRDLGKRSIEDIKTIFELINSANYALNSIEINNARYSGEFKRFCEQFAARSEFKKWKVFKAGDIRRMQDLRYCMVLAATLLSTYFNRDDEIETYLIQYNDSFDGAVKLEAEIDKTFAFIESLALPQGTRAYQKTDLFTLFVEVHRALFRRQVALEMDSLVASRLLNFFNKVEAAKAASDSGSLEGIYYKTTVRAAIDRINRYRRGEIIQSVLDTNYTPQLRSLHEPVNDSQEELGLEEGDY